MDIGVLSGRITLEDDASSSLKLFGTNLDKIGGALTSAGSTLTLGLTAPLVAAAGASLLFAGNFEASMTRLVSLAGVSKEELTGVKQHILDLAPAVGIGPQALAEAMMKVSSTVSNTAVALSILDTAAKLSAAGMGEAVQVAGAITAVINSYGAENITAARAADILTQAVKDGGAEAKELAPTLANVVPIAAQMGVSFEEVGANLATLTKLGVPTAEAVTQLTAVFTALLKETKQGSEALATVGMSYAGLRLEIKDKGLMETLVHLSTVFKGNETGLTDVFGRIEALKNVMGTAGQQAGTYAQVLDNVKHSSDGLGQSQEVFNAMQGKQLQTWGQVSAALQVAAIKFGDSLAPAMGAVLNLVLPLLEKVSALADWFAKLSTPVQGAAIGFLALVAAAGPLLMVIGSVASGVTALIPLIPVLGTAFASLSGGLAMFGPAIAIIATAIASWKIGTWLGEMSGLTDWVERTTGKMLGLSKSEIEAGMAARKFAESHTTVVKPAIVSTTTAVVAHVEAQKAVITKTKEQIQAAKDYAEKLVAVNLKIADAARDVGNLTVTQKDYILSTEGMRLSNDDLAIKLRVSELAVKDFKGELDETVNRMKNMRAEADKLRPSIGGIGFKMVREDVTLLKSTMNEFHGGLTVMGQEVSTTTIPMFRTLGENVIPKNTAALKDAREEAKKVTGTLQELAGAFAQLAQISGDSFGGLVKDIARVVSAMAIADQSGKDFKKAATPDPDTGKRDWGGMATGIVGVIGALDAATSSGSKTKNVLGGITTGMAAGAQIAGPWGAAIGAAVGFIVGMFRDVESQVNPVREAFVQLNGGLMALDLKAHNAGITLTAMLNAKNPEQYKKAIDDINAALKFQDDSMKTLNDTVAKYGFTISELGPAFAAQKLSEGFAQLYQDTLVLKAGGIDYDLILGKQAEKYQSLVTQAGIAGVSIPLQMKPVLADMIGLGLLTDAAGVKLTDVSQLTFSETLDSKFQTLITSIGKLVDAITRGLGGAIMNIPQPSPIDVTFRGHWDMDKRPGFDGQGYSHGGKVIQGPWGVSGMGTDTTLAALTPGEGVVTTEGMSRLGSDGLDALNSGKPSSELQGLRDDQRATSSELAAIKKLLADQPRAMSIAMQDAIVLLPRRSA